MRVSALPELQAYPPSFSPPPKAAMEARDFSRVSLHSETYYSVYMQDLLESHQNIVISSPVISGPKVHELIDVLKEKQAAGISITIVTWEADAYGFGDSAYWMQLHDEMRQAGFFIKAAEETCERFAIIDQDIVWYGSMNLLGKITMEDSMMRVSDRNIAAELMELTFGRKQ